MKYIFFQIIFSLHSIFCFNQTFSNNNRNLEEIQNILAPLDSMDMKAFNIFNQIYLNGNQFITQYPSINKIAEKQKLVLNQTIDMKKLLEMLYWCQDYKTQSLIVDMFDIKKRRLNNILDELEIYIGHSKHPKTNKLIKQFKNYINVYISESLRIKRMIYN